MELREPPRTPQTRPADGTVRLLLIVNLVAVIAVGALVLAGRGGPNAAGADPEHVRQVASELKAAGALDQAALLYERYLELSNAAAEERAKIAYSVGTTYLEQGEYSKALRWFYEAESLGAGSLSGEVGKKIVHTLERLGRFHAAKAALDARTQLAPDTARHADDDPVVARIGSEEVHRSDVDRALDDLPPELARAFSAPDRRQEFLKKYVADELLWRKAVKLEYDRHPEVQRRHAALLKQLAVGKLVEQELAATIAADEADVRNFFEANPERYQRVEKEGDEPRTPDFDEVRPMVERDYRLMKLEAAYNQTIESELATEDVELFPQRMVDGG